MTIGGTFRCGHPRTPENSTSGYLHPNGNRYHGCALCRRARTIVQTVDRQIERWKCDKLSHGERILRRLG